MTYLAKVFFLSKQCGFQMCAFWGLVMTSGLCLNQ